jgi:hypothetical protein
VARFADQSDGNDACNHGAVLIIAIIRLSIFEGGLQDQPKSQHRMLVIVPVLPDLTDGVGHFSAHKCRHTFARMKVECKGNH